MRKIFDKYGKCPAILLKEEERRAFRKLDPAARLLRMENLLHEVISIKAKEQGVSEGEIYYRYIERDKKRRRGV